MTSVSKRSTVSGRGGNSSANKIFWLASYPKSGNTWFRAFLNSLLNPNTPLDINKLGYGQHPNQRVNFDELNGFSSTDLTLNEIDRIRPASLSWLSANSDHEQYFKTHAAYIDNDQGYPILGSVNEGIAGALYFVRNPLDVCISYAHHCSVTVDRSIELLADNDLHSHKRNVTHFIPEYMGSWSEHVNSWIKTKSIDTLVIRYEDMLAAQMETFTQACIFLRLNLDSLAIKNALNSCSFKTLQSLEKRTNFLEKPKESKQFFRKGIAGGWQKVLSCRQVDKIIKNHGETMAALGYLDSGGKPRIQ